MNANVRTVYALQYGTWYSFTAAQWLALVTEAAEGSGHELPYSRMLTGRPAVVRGDLESGLYATSGARIVRPLDWTPEDWRWELHLATVTTCDGTCGASA